MEHSKATTLFLLQIILITLLHGVAGTIYLKRQKRESGLKSGREDRKERIHVTGGNSNQSISHAEETDLASFGSGNGFTGLSSDGRRPNENATYSGTSGSGIESKQVRQIDESFDNLLRGNSEGRDSLELKDDDDDDGSGAGRRKKEEDGSANGFVSLEAPFKEQMAIEGDSSGDSVAGSGKLDDDEVNKEVSSGGNGSAEDSLEHPRTTRKYRERQSLGTEMFTPRISKRSMESNDGWSLLREFFELNQNPAGTEGLKITKRHIGEQDDSLPEIKVRKRSMDDVFDLGDETIPNLSYVDNGEESNGLNDARPASEEIRVKKRDVIDADNSVRFLDEMTTHNLLTEKENEMIERITRGLSPVVEHGAILNNEQLDRKVNKRDEVTNHEQPIHTGGLTSTQGTKERFKETLEGIRKKRSEILDIIPTRNSQSRILNKRNVILDTDKDIDVIMAYAGHPAETVKEKRFAANDDYPIARGKISGRYASFIRDDITDLTPLNNEYLQTMKRNLHQKKNREINRKISSEKKHGDKFPDGLVGSYAKPTHVAGFWSGLGSKPVFVERNELREVESHFSGSGSESVEQNKLINSEEAKPEAGSFQPEQIGNIMNLPKHEKHSMLSGNIRYRGNSKQKLNNADKNRNKRMDNEDEKRYDINKGNSQIVLAFDDVHEIISKQPKRLDTATIPKRKRSEIQKVSKKHGKAKQNIKKQKPAAKETKDWNEDTQESEGDWDDTSGDEESGDEETIKQVRSYSEDDVKVATLSATYKRNDEEATKRDLIIIKRAPDDNGYLGCFVDVLHPIRDLSVRAGIPFVTINNCRSACKRTGYYYAGLQFGYLCFCGNSYGKYDMAPDSECYYQCSGNENQTCGGLWRNSVYSTAGAPDDSTEGPVPIYLTPRDKEILPQIDANNTRRSEIPQPGNINVTTTTSTTYTAPPQGQQDILQQPNSSFAWQNITETKAAANSGNGNATADPSNTKRRVLMHFAYLHPQHDAKVEPTTAPSPTPPLAIEPETRVFKGEIKLKQKWFDEFRNKMSTKSQILAGNVEQALKNIYTNNSQFHDFLKAEVLSFREGIINNNPYTVTRVIVEFALTFNKNAISPDAKLFSTVRAKKRLDEMPVYPKSLKVSEYRFDPNSPNQPFKIPVAEPNITDGDYNSTDGDDWRRSFIPLTNLEPELQAGNQDTSYYQPINGKMPATAGMQELQAYLSGATAMKNGVQAAEATGASSSSQEELMKRSSIDSLEEKRRKVPYILRLFFWKDMLARKKRFSANEKSIIPLTRSRRGDIENNSLNYEEISNQKRLSNKDLPLTEGNLSKRRLTRKIRRRNKDLTTEKELKRSKRFDRLDLDVD